METPWDKPVRSSGGLRPPEENEFAPIVAAVCDRRIENETGAHRDAATQTASSPLHGAWIGRYALTPDHLHLFVSVGEISLSNWVKSLKNALSKTLRTAGQEWPHWQKGFFDHLLPSGKSYSQKWDYVRKNPVHAELLESAEDCPFAGEIHDLEYRK